VNGEVNTKLIADLVRLAKKYRPEEWMSIIDWLQDPERRKGIVTLMRELSAVSGKTENRPRRRRNVPSIAHLLDEVRRSDLRKAEILQEIHSKLQSREILPTFNTLRMFTETAGLAALSSRKREQAINELMRQLSILPYEKIQSVLQKASIGRPDFGEDYERWVALILGNKAGDELKPKRMSRKFFEQ